MSDLISRQAAIELAMQYCPDDDGTCSKADEDMRNLLDELEDLPSAQPEQRWIPCSERLPESGVGVLTQYSDYSMSVDFRTASSSGWFWADGEDDLPIAWMPLPEPYKAESEEQAN